MAVRPSSSDTPGGAATAADGSTGSTTTLLQLEQVTVERGEVTILDRIDLTIPHGRHTAVVGPNGAGKTSLLKLLLRHFYPSVTDRSGTGTVRILGRTVWEVAELWRRMGVVSAELDRAFTRGRSGAMTALQVVASGFTAVELPERVGPLSPPMRRAAEEALAAVDASPLQSRTLETMSTGERRRVLIARALVHRPEILVLDEPTTGLDLAARHSFLRMLQSVVATGSTTLVLVTHHIEEIVPAIEQVVLLGHGRIVADAPKPQALTGEALSALYQTPIEVSFDVQGYPHARVLS
jgi:iron complex transport system ATP-binding protein